MSDSIAVTRISLLRLLTIEFRVVAYVYTLLSKTVVSVISLAPQYQLGTLVYKVHVNCVSITGPNQRGKGKL
jgi:hypothetical protein